ncbi:MULTISPECIES: DUF2516 family protein [unclassified Ornithinimicrobium]|uniref:DUF2516 family protein n=1 Tax=unclassified Ornithinimicrobium TaxID=2615080 RepID=UPI0038542BB0
MPAIFQVQSLLQSVVGVALLAMMVWALVDCLRTRADAFPAAGKRTKNFWLLLTGIASVVGFIFMFSPFNIFNVAAVVVAAVYHADVKPAVKTVRGGGAQGTHMGPYGPW